MRPPLFIDMLHSNNAARVRLWLACKRLPVGTVQTRMVTYADLKTPEYAKINPLRKVPALLHPHLYESAVILNYLEHKFHGVGEVSHFSPESAEQRAKMDFLIRTHDLYIASPNCSQPGFSHTQGHCAPVTVATLSFRHGYHIAAVAAAATTVIAVALACLTGAMYLAPYETEHCKIEGSAMSSKKRLLELRGRSAERVIDRPTRAAKVKEIWTQLTLLENSMCDKSAHLVPSEGLTLADFTWFPTCVFMDFMLPRVFGWPPSLLNPSAAGAPSPFPKLAAWYSRLHSESEAFARVRSDIWGFWEVKESQGQFSPILEETRDASYKWRYP